MDVVTYALLFASLYFEVFLLVSFLEKRAERRAARAKRGASAAPEPALPSAAIVVPCFNEERGVASTLESLLALEYPAGRLELIVVDDGSRDRTLAIARSLEGVRRGIPVRVFAKENGGKHTAMNLALEHTNAELIGCLDADSVVDARALRRIARVFENREVAAVTPGIHVRAPETILQHMQNVEYRLSVFNRFMLSALGSAFVAPGPFSVFRASVVRELGGWRHGHSTEDMELALRIQAAGHLIANAPGAAVHTTAPRTLRQLFNQRVRWTYGFLRNAADYRYMLANRAYGNLGILVLPLALVSIGAALYFFARIVLSAAHAIIATYTRIELTGLFPHPSLELYYVNTSAMWFLVWIAVALILVLVGTGSRIGGKKTLPLGTPLFVLFYSLLVPLWLGTALVRAVFKTGVSWR
ncbi:hypothetical protein A3C21_00805 [Candidatus Kaiserbacteria bacterium RIFCSPHIGHO2_02_FULL_59_21]|nr:MAG: hypothetical protein A2766_02305 [Candidatus Kaiserbacteria bacterium RIFCSPHIGHO2_01_FULL_58_22]OGG67246.1 MAG: hypothetical protein A3C21_00805 [Candidatus Kaiserbacteria bacterium RIFCSPHIGHO2_02_FULL_59_21]OGG86500.1 MAG: hypothetical protein A3I47_00880 [Candidatus Kaiserbacteria bacterium RIFCSPLOWO2_02_FULL_59_19]